MINPTGKRYARRQVEIFRQLLQSLALRTVTDNVEHQPPLAEYRCGRLEQHVDSFQGHQSTDKCSAKRCAQRARLGLRKTRRIDGILGEVDAFVAIRRCDLAKGDLGTD